MGKHLAGCVGTGPTLHIAVDEGPGTWWMHVALSPSATLREFDTFLRATWLECCGHMSAFEVGGTRFESHLVDGEHYWGPKPRSMAAKASSVLGAGTVFSYEYDFGSTTTLRGRVLGGLQAGRGKITLLARNEPITWPCAGCEGAATRVCPCCGAMACASCKPPCDCVDSWEDETLPVVNSPRMGVCGYTG